MNNALRVGHSIYLRLPTEQDVSAGNWHHWYNDPQTTLYNQHGVFFISRDKELDYVVNSLNSSDRILFAVCCKKTDALIGNCCIANISLLNGNGEITITIGEAKYRNKTAALEVIGLMLEHGFGRLNLHKMVGGSHEKLASFVKMLAYLGFKSEGIFKDHIRRDGKYWDHHQYAVFEDDFCRLRESRGGSIICNSYSDLIRSYARFEN